MRRRARGDQVVENAVDRALVEDAVVPEAPEVELEALELDAVAAGTYEMRIVAKSGAPPLSSVELGGVAFDAAERAERGELVGLDHDFVVAIGVRIRERSRAVRVWACCNMRGCGQGSPLGATFRV